MTSEGRRRLRQSLAQSLAGKADRLRLFPAALGAYVNGQKTLRVAGRKDFVWCRLRGSTSEVIQALNETVGFHWDLPVLVYRDPNAPDRWKVYGRDVRQYEDWQGASYLPPHGDAHTFAGAPRTGADVVWIAKRQYMPLMPRPVATGTMGIYLEADFYYFGGRYHWWPGSGTADLTSMRPTGANDGRFVTVYISGSAGIPAFLPGPEFNANFPPTDPGQFILLPDPQVGIPLVAVFLLSGTQRIGWGELYDLRLPGQAPAAVAGITGSILALDEGVLLGAASHIDFVGAGVTATMSGSFLRVSIPGGGGAGGSGTVQIRDEGVPLGSADILDFVGAGVTASLSGSYARISIPGGGGGGGGGGTGTATYVLAGQAEALDEPTHQFWRVPVYPYATGSLAIMLNGVWQKPGADYTEQFPDSGTYALTSIPPTGTISSAQWGVAVSAGGTPLLTVLDEGLDIGQASFMDFVGDGIEASISGTFVKIASHVSGTVVLAEDGAILGSVRLLDFRGSVAVQVSGTYGTVEVQSSPGGGGSAGVFGLDDGVPLGTGTSIDFGTYLSATISGSRLRVDSQLQTGIYQVEELIYSVQLASATGSIVISPLPQSFDHVRWDLFARGDYGVADNTDLAVILNGDNTAANYRRISHVAVDGTHNIFVADSNVGIHSIPTAGGLANLFGWSKGELPYYTVTGSHHVIRSHGGERRNTASSILLDVQMNWEQLQAITSLRLSPVSGSFVAGTRLRLFGVGLQAMLRAPA